MSKSHKVQLGFDVNTISGSQFFNSFGVPQDDPANNQPTILDARHLSGGDKSVYAQDDWTTGRMLINYGLRYDVHQADITTSQVSPRLNLTYTAGKDNREEVLRELEEIFPRWYDRQITESGALGPSLVVDTTRPHSFEETVRGYLEQELINEDEPTRQAVLARVETLMREMQL